MRIQTGFSVLTALLLAAGLGVAGCSDDADGNDTTTSGNSSGSGGDTTSSATAGGAGGMMVPAGPLARRTISGDATWNVNFDAEAKLAGATDCSYTRHYEGVQDDSALWLCPSCEIMFRADVQMTAGRQDCFTQISTGTPALVEWIGYGGGTWYRGLGGPMSEQGTAMLTRPAIVTSNAVVDLDAPLGGLFGFDIGGAFTMGDEEADPLNGFVPPDSYACGWPKADPPKYEGDYAVTIGQTVPDGLFKDACDETVRLHDLKGAYLFVDMSAMDCPPCRTMASQEEQFIANMAAQGITVRVVTLLAPSLADVLGETTNAMLNAWVDDYQLTSPVLADRGWGISMFLPHFPDDMGYPSWVLVDPDLKVLDVGNGFGSFAVHEQAILADQP
jgi:hypothetical protein